MSLQNGCLVVVAHFLSLQDVIFLVCFFLETG